MVITYAVLSQVLHNPVNSKGNKNHALSSVSSHLLIGPMSLEIKTTSQDSVSQK